MNFGIGDLFQDLVDLQKELEHLYWRMMLPKGKILSSFL
jgi:hypothetical protein